MIHIFRFTDVLHYRFMHALCTVGVCYKDGKGVAKNKPEAKKYLKLAADQGFAGAAVKLSQFWF